MVQSVEALCASAELKPGDRVRTLGGTTRGVVLHKLEDGRIAWRPDGTTAELIGLPESLMTDGPPSAANLPGADSPQPKKS